MARAKDVFDRVREAQRMLGSGEVDEAMARAEPLLDQARRLLEKPGLTSFEKSYAGAAATYASVVLVLGYGDSRPPAEAVPAIRQVLVEAVARHQPGIETWKALAAGSEMLARAGDAEGAVWAVRKARSLGKEEDYLVQLSGSIKSMYPQVFAEAPDSPPDEPPELPKPRR